MFWHHFALNNCSMIGVKYIILINQIYMYLVSLIHTVCKMGCTSFICLALSHRFSLFRFCKRCFLQTLCSNLRQQLRCNKFETFFMFAYSCEHTHTYTCLYTLTHTHIYIEAYSQPLAVQHQIEKQIASSEKENCITPNKNCVLDKR